MVIAVGDLGLDHPVPTAGIGQRESVPVRLGHSSTRLTMDLYRHTLQARAATMADAMGDILDG